MIKAETIVDENFSGLSDLIEDVEVLATYRNLIIECIERHTKSAIQELLQEYHTGNVNMVRYGGKHKTIDEIALGFIKNNFPIRKP